MCTVGRTIEFLFFVLTVHLQRNAVKMNVLFYDRRQYTISVMVWLEYPLHSRFDFGSIPSFSHAKDLKMVFTASLLGAQQERCSEDKKLAILLVPLGKVLSAITPSLC